MIAVAVHAWVTSPLADTHPPHVGRTDLQDKSLIEIIVVDAGCKDNTMAAVASMKLGVKLRCAYIGACDALLLSIIYSKYDIISYEFEQNNFAV